MLGLLGLDYGQGWAAHNLMMGHNMTPAPGSEQLRKAHAFQALHARAGAFIIPNPWDAGTARILAFVGFEALATTSAGLAFALGRKDGAATREETLANARDIVEATNIPVAADLENGFGDSPPFVAETIRLAAATGLVGGSIEDATGDQENPIYDFNFAIERVAAAVEAARSLNFPFTLTARAENFLHGRADLDDTIHRLQAFEKAGADVLFAPGLPNLDAIREVCASVKRPVNAIANAAFTLKQLADAGAKRVSTGSAISRTALQAVWDAAHEMKEAGTFDYAKDIMSHAKANALMRPKNLT
jgi:2-methylisocitrate lyase-like PEP mutase family enzyme